MSKKMRSSQFFPFPVNDRKKNRMKIEYRRCLSAGFFPNFVQISQVIIIQLNVCSHLRRNLYYCILIPEFISYLFFRFHIVFDSAKKNSHFINLISTK